MRIRNVAALRGWHWIAEGFALFIKSPLVWAALVAAAAVAAFLLSLIGRIGPLLLSLLVPGLMAGLLMGCRELDMGRRLQLGHLAAGFLHRPVALIAIGGVYLVGTMLIGQFMITLGGEELVALIELAQEANPGQDQMQALFTQVAPVLLGGTMAFLLLMLCTWYAPPLIVFHDAKVLESMGASLVGCLRNVLPMLVYGALTYAISTVVALALGTFGLLVVMPVLLPSSYTSYKDIFGGRVPPGPGPAEG